MQTAYAEVHEIVSKNPFREGCREIQSLVRESGNNRVKSEDVIRLTGRNRLSVLNVSKARESNVVRSEAISAHNVVHAHRGGMIT